MECLAARGLLIQSDYLGHYGVFLCVHNGLLESMIDIFTIMVGIAAIYGVIRSPFYGLIYVVLSRPPRCQT